MDAKVEKLLETITDWTSMQADIIGLALIGSFARGDASPDSDIDLILITKNSDHYINHTEWVQLFGKVSRLAVEYYGEVTSLRVFYSNGVEVEFGITNKKWISQPIEEGTQQVIKEGFRILYEQGSMLSKLIIK